MKLRRTYSELRGYLERRYSRGDVKRLLVQGGCDPRRMASIPVSSDMKTPGYKSMSAILSEGYDTIPGDFSDDDTDQIILTIAQHVLREHQDQWEEPEAALARSLEADGVSIEEGVAQMAGVAAECAAEANLDEAARLLGKAVVRLIDDVDGAVTASVSAAESALQKAREILGISPPSQKTLPRLLVSLRRQSNLEDLFGNTSEGRRAAAALSSLVENLYAVSHEQGDRHGGAASPTISNTGAALLVGACGSLITAVADGIRRGELAVKL